MTARFSSAETRLWRSQIWTIAKSEVRRTLFSRRSLAVYLLVAMPLALMVLRAIFMPDTLRVNAPDATNEFAEVFFFFILRFVVFFANAVIFVRLFRGEMLERSLHYTLLAPIRRGVLVTGKYLGGVLSATLLLVPATALTYLLVFLPHGRAGLTLMLSAAGIANLLTYLLIVILACFAYGALFMLAGLYFKNPMIPALIFLGWEMLTPFLPPLLKSLSFVHYLASFVPVPVTLGAFAILARPVSWWVAFPALLLSAALLVYLASRAARKLEVTYSAE
jgi:ABC-type transport system involved in multi-copper enzyme maturation permease subunit